MTLMELPSRIEDAEESSLDLKGESMSMVDSITEEMIYEYKREKAQELQRFQDWLQRKRSSISIIPVTDHPYLKLNPCIDAIVPIIGGMTVQIHKSEILYFLEYHRTTMPSSLFYWLTVYRKDLKSILQEIRKNPDPILSMSNLMIGKNGRSMGEIVCRWDYWLLEVGIDAKQQSPDVCREWVETAQYLDVLISKRKKTQFDTRNMIGPKEITEQLSGDNLTVATNEKDHVKDKLKQRKSHETDW